MDGVQQLRPRACTPVIPRSFDIAGHWLNRRFTYHIEVDRTNPGHNGPCGCVCFTWPSKASFDCPACNDASRSGLFSSEYWSIERARPRAGKLDWTFLKVVSARYILELIVARTNSRRKLRWVVQRPGSSGSILLGATTCAWFRHRLSSWSKDTSVLRAGSASVIDLPDRRSSL